MASSKADFAILRLIQDAPASVVVVLVVGLVGFIQPWGPNTARISALPFRVRTAQGFQDTPIPNNIYGG